MKKLKCVFNYNILMLYEQDGDWFIQLQDTRFIFLWRPTNKHIFEDMS